jgi:hypothetical protein
LPIANATLENFSRRIQFFRLIEAFVQVDGTVFQETPYARDASQRKIIVDPAKKSGEPLASKQLINERYLFASFAIEIIHNPIADGTFRANLSRIAFYVVMLVNLQRKSPLLELAPYGSFRSCYGQKRRFQGFYTYYQSELLSMDEKEVSF